MKRLPRRLHRWVGAVLLLPCVLWAVTGLLFHWKPGWSEAYAPLEPRTYPLRGGVVPADGFDATGEGLLETRRLRTLLGEHLLVRDRNGWSQRDPVSGETRPEPPPPDRLTLFQDALRANPERFGTLDRVDGWTARTSTGVEVTLDWDRLAFTQRGPDTRRIDFLYQVHYLQWTGTEWGDRILPLIGLGGLLLLSGLGLRLLLRPGSAA